MAGLEKEYLTPEQQATRDQAAEWWRSLSINQLKAECEKHGVICSLSYLRSFQEELWTKAGRPEPQENPPIPDVSKAGGST